MFALVQLAAFVVVIQGASSLKCYELYRRLNGTTVMGMSNSDNVGSTCTDPTKCVCASYRAQCTDDAITCTSSEVQTNTTKWFYKMVPQDTCTNMTQAASMYMNVTCCNTDMCNNQSIPPMLQCYAIETNSNGTTAIGTFNGVTVGLDCDVLGGCVCASYRAECMLAYLACTDSEVKAKTVKWFYKIMSVGTCAIYRNSTSFYTDVTCCNTDLCNKQGMGSAASTVAHSFSAWMTLLILCITFN